MSDNKSPIVTNEYAHNIRRREALKQLLTTPALVAVACGTSDGQQNPGGLSPSASTGLPGASTSPALNPPALNPTGSGSTGGAASSAPTNPPLTTSAASQQATTATAAASTTPASASESAASSATQSASSPASASAPASSSASAATSNSAAGSSATPDGGAPGGAFATATPADFDGVASCTLTPTDPAGEGPFFIHDDEVMDDPGLFRADARDGKPGVELQLHLRVLDTTGACETPISDVEVYIWHTDALGFYSGFNNQNPDQTYSGAFEREVENSDRFCRAAGITNEDGIVSFRTIYPGWYNGRAIHIHFVCLKKGSGPSTQSYRGRDYQVFTTQMYFEETFSRNIHEHNEPYTERASGNGYNQYVKPETQTRPTLKMVGNVAVGALNILTNPADPRR